ncbi:MAG: penicillin acylase family protein, partial [Gemmatimonadaceae bacterium]
MMRVPCHRWASLLGVSLLLVCAATTTVAAQARKAPSVAPTAVSRVMSHVEVRRTDYGVPHIRADNMEAAGFGL